MIRTDDTYYLATSSLCLLLLLIFVQSCKDTSQITGIEDRVQLNQDTMKVYTVRLTGVSLQPIEKEETEEGFAFSWSDTLQNQIKFEAVPEYNVLDSTVVTKRPMEERVSYEVVNPIESSSSNAMFKFNKPVLFKNITVKAGRNFIADSVLSEFVDFPSQLHPAGRGQVELNMDHFFIPPKKYTVQAAWQTEKGERFTDSTQVFINFNQ